MLPGLSDETRLSSRTNPPETAPGFACSLLLHILFAILIVYIIVHSPRQSEQPLAKFLPVDIVPLTEHTASPPQVLRAAAPHEAPTPRAHVVPSSPHRPVALSPTRRQPVQDPLEIRLKQLAKLRQPDSTVPHLENGASDDMATTNDASAGTAGYGVSDFLRAQVERRWSLDLKRARNAIILLHVKVARDGTVTEAKIVDRARYANDAAWREVALSARNAVLLSSPLNLPANYAGGPIDVTLAMNPKDVMR
ncbi:MAG TPA: hypothetical protein VHY79_00720 [Rhizomicrobium sp.]|jgi:hypothetical protein|nr:hypothetical protein [Rhizomicrobium sp.]